MPITVTATQGGNTANGMVLRVLVLPGAADAIGQTGATATADNVQHATIVTTVTGSRVYGAAVKGPNNAQSPVAGTTVIDEIADATNGERYYTFKATSATGTPGSTNIGINIADPGGCALVEILPDGTVTEDPSGPAAQSTTSATTLTSASFDPPPGALLIALVASDGGSGQTTMSVTGGPGVWAEVAKANAANDDYAGVWIAQTPPSDPFDPVITATQQTSTSPGILLRLMIIQGAKPSAQQVGATATKSASTGANQASITTTQTGSRVYGAITGNLAPTAAGTTTFIDNFNDTTHTLWYTSIKATSATGTPGATTIGSTVSAGGGCALYEILAAGTITEDTIDAPALATSTAAITVATNNFNAPPGSLLVALVASSGGAAVTGMTVSGGGITWTQKVAAHATAQDYAGVWIADIPQPSATHKVPRSLILPWDWPGGPPLRRPRPFEANVTAGGGATQNFDATLTETAGLTSDMVSTKPVDGSLTGFAVLIGTGASTKPVDATLAAAGTLTAATAVTKPIDATLAGAAALTAAATSTKPVDATLAVVSTATAAASGTKPVDGALTVTASRTGAALTTKPVDASLTNTATLTATASVVTAGKNFDAALTATATGSATAASTKPVDGVLAGTATLAATGASTKPIDASQTVTATRTAAATSTKPVDGALAAVTTLTGSAASTKPVNASLTATATLTAAMSTTPAGKNFDATLTATATLTSAASVVKPVDATRSVVATLTAAAVNTKSVASALPILATLTADMAVIPLVTVFVRVSLDNSATDSPDLSGSLATTGQVGSHLDTTGSVSSTATMTGQLDD